MLRAPAQGCHLRDTPVRWLPAPQRPRPCVPVFADEMNDQQNTLSYVLINPPPDTRLEPNDIV